MSRVLHIWHCREIWCIAKCSVDGELASLVASANLLLQDTIERIHVGKEYGDIPRGLFIVRGENVVLMGEVVSVGGWGRGTQVGVGVGTQEAV